MSSRSPTSCWLNAREARKVRSVDVERSRFRVHVMTAPFASWPVPSITRQDCKAFLESLPKKDVSLKRFGKRAKPRKISATTTKHVRTLLHGILQSAVEDGLIASNPVADLKLKLPGADREPWT